MKRTSTIGFFMLCAACALMMTACQKKAAVSQPNPAEEAVTLSEADLASPFSHLLQAVAKPFQRTYARPLINMSRNADPDLSAFTEEEQAFFRTYVGSYMYKNNATYEWLARNRYMLNLARIENGIRFYRIGRDGYEIRYNPSEHGFYASESHAADRINNLSAFRLGSDRLKISAMGNEESIIETVVKRMDKEVARMAKKPIDEDGIRTLLLTFFRALGEKDYPVLLDCLDTEHFIHIGYNMRTESLTVDDLYSGLYYLHTCFTDNGSPVAVLADVYFSELPDLISETYGDCTLIELIYSGYENYFSLVIKQTPDGLKIVGWRADFNME